MDAVLRIIVFYSIDEKHIVRRWLKIYFCPVEVTNAHSSVAERSPYRNPWVKVIGSFLIAHFIEVLGNSDSWLILLQQRAYYIEVGTGFLIALILWQYIAQVTTRLDRAYDWVTFPMQRMGLQFFFGIVVSAILIYFLIALQFKFVLHSDITEGSWLLYEFPVAILIAAGINGFYISCYFFMRWRKVEALLRSSQERIPEAEEVAKSAVASGEVENLKPTVLLARKGTKNVPVELKDIAYIYKDDALNHLQTFHHERFTLDYSLEESERLLPSSSFFRANRQFIISFSSIASFSSIEFGKIKVVLKLKDTPEIVVSQKRAPAFRHWIKNKGVVKSSP
jgi:hypothetical protein